MIQVKWKNDETIVIIVHFLQRLFVLPQYDAVLIEQSLLLNRRRNEKEHLKQKLEEHFEDMDITDGISSLGRNIHLLILPSLLCNN